MKPVFFKQPLRLLLTLLFPFFFSQMAHALAIKSKQSGSWTSASTWEGGVVPTDNDDVWVKIGHTVTRSTGFVSHGFLQVDGAMVFTGSVSREYYPGSTVEIQGVLRVEGGTFFAGDIVYGNGLFKQTAGATTFYRAIVLQYTEILGGTVYYQNINNGNLYLDYLTLKNATLEVDGAENLYIKNSMSWNTGGKLVPGSVINIESGATLTFGDGGTCYNDATVLSHGTIRSGTAAISALTAGGTIYNYGAWEANVPSGAMTVSKQILYNSGAASFLKKGAGSMVFAPSSRFSNEYDQSSVHLQQGSLSMKAWSISVFEGSWLVDAGCVLTFTDDGLSSPAQFYRPSFINNGQVKGSTLKFNSGYATTLGGNGKFEKVEIAKTGEDVTLVGSPEITQELKLTSGRIVLNQFDLRLGTALVTHNGDDNCFIQTNGSGACVRTCPPNIFTNFPIGAEKYAPVIVKLNAGSTQDNIKARVTDDFYGEYIGTNPACSGEITRGVVGHNWLLSEQVAGGSNADIWAAWLADAERYGFDRNHCTLGRYINSDWSANGFSAATTIGSLIQAYSANQTAFGLFGVWDDAHLGDVNFITPAPMANSPICEWKDLQLHANTSPNADIEWTGPNGFQSNDPDPIVQAIQLSQGGSYAVSASQYGCPGKQAFVTVQVDAEPTASVIGPDHLQAGETATLTAYGGTSFLWSTGASTQSISIAPTQITDYVVTVTNPSGCTATVLHTVQVLGATATKEVDGTLEQIKITPNPASDAAVLTFESATTGEAQMIITDTRGAQLFRQHTSIETGHNQLQISLGKLPAGTYQVTLIRENEVKTIRLVKMMGE